MCFILSAKGQGIKIGKNQFKLGFNHPIKLAKGDRIVACIDYNDQTTKEIVFVTRNAWGSRFLLSDIREMGIGGAGVMCVKVTYETGNVVGAIGLSKETSISLKLNTDTGRTLLTKEIPILRRGSKGVCLLNLAKWVVGIK